MTTLHGRAKAREGGGEGEGGEAETHAIPQQLSMLAPAVRAGTVDEGRAGSSPPIAALTSRSAACARAGSGAASRRTARVHAIAAGTDSPERAAIKLERNHCRSSSDMYTMYTELGVFLGFDRSRQVVLGRAIIS